ncbi:MAG TPA: MMPL family transporter [Burkholderiaceae bacterium]|nr:MMPL family transporter [Burkholderiaceae bacterium]
MSHGQLSNDEPVIRDLRDFDARSGTLVERLLFNNRLAIAVLCLIVTALLGYQALGLTLNAAFEKMIPTRHPYIVNYLANKAQIAGLGNSLRIAVEVEQGTIFDAQYLDTVRKITDEVFLYPGVDRPYMKSLWTPSVRWTGVTEDGLDGGPVIPDTYDGSPGSLDQVRVNVERSGEIGLLVAANYRSSIILLPLQEKVAETGQPIDYHALSGRLEQLRAKYETRNIHIHITGFAKVVGDLLDGLREVLVFFGLAIAICAGVLYWHTRCARSTALVVLCSLVAVIWLLGLLPTLGLGLDPYSVLVPFLVFAIGMSHGAQKMNGIMQDVGRGTHKYVAARYTFRRLIVAGVTALLADVVGFAVLMVIDIPVIRELAMTASLGVAVLIFTNLILLPVLLSYVGVSPTAAKRSLAEEKEEVNGLGLGKAWSLLDHFTERRWATVAILASVTMAVGGYFVALDLKVGDLDAGAPELRPDSRYNRDNAFITGNYQISSDVFAVMVKTAPEGCRDWQTITEIDRLSATLEQVPGVQRASSLADTMRAYVSGSTEGNPKWLTIPDNQSIVDGQINNVIAWNSEFVNNACSLSPALAYLTDHKAETLDGVVKVASQFAAKHDNDDRKFLLAAGSAGIDAATNIVVAEANRTMLMYVYAAVIVLCAITFRSWRAVVVAVLPLILTSVLAEALMVKLGIGVKVATLPVVALGVGIGVDYALYLLSVQLAQQRMGFSLGQAYHRAVAFTGKVVALVGVTLAAGVVTWAWSPIKFQADMGILLTFMFLWNMLGALILIPALSHFLLQGETRQAAKAPDENIMPEEALAEG